MLPPCEVEACISFCNGWEMKGAVFKDKATAWALWPEKSTSSNSYFFLLTRWRGVKPWPVVGWFCWVFGCVSSQCLSVWIRPKLSHKWSNWNHLTALWVISSVSYTVLSLITQKNSESSKRESFWLIESQTGLFSWECTYLGKNLKAI